MPNKDIKVPSLKNKLFMYIGDRYPRWVNGGEVERVSIDWGYKASNGSRRARDLEIAGAIERRIKNGSVEYRVIKKPYIEPTDEEKMKRLSEVMG